MTNKRKLYQTFLMTMVMMLLFPLTAAAENVGYAVYEQGISQLTFKYGEKPAAVESETVYDLNEESNVPGWLNKKIDKVSFHESFKNARPTSCYKWFYYRNSLEQIDGIENLNTSEVTNMSEMFYGCSSLYSLDLSNLNTSKVTNMRHMFSGCSMLTSLNLSNFNTSEVKDMTGLFNGCSSLKSLDLSKFNTSKVESMWSMFSNCSGLESLDLKNFNTSEVKDMVAMFHGCSKLKSLDLSNFNTSKVASMEEMFYGCSGLTSLDLSNFNTSKVRDMKKMFYGCTGLTTIYASDKFPDNITSNNMFSGCTRLSGAIRCDGRNNIDCTYANYYSGYFTCGIKTAEDLASFAKCVNTEGKEGGVAVLLNDITMTAEDNFTPVTCNYTGKFDGQGHTISGLNLSESKNCLFAQNGGTIKNLGVVNAKVAEGVTGSICQTNSRTIESCFFTGTTEGTTSPSGAVCQTNSATITNCYYLANSETDEIEGTTAMTAAQFKSGAVAWLLNGSSPYGEWGQQLGTEDYPVLGGAKVYQCSPCTGVYSNTKNKAGYHLFGENDNGFCHNCGVYEPAVLTTNKYDINGDTTKDNVYEIGNAGQLYWFAGLVNGDKSVCDYDANSNQNGTQQNLAACAVLTANIVVNSGVLKADGSIAGDVSGFSPWTPIGNSYAYTGTFDGKGYTVSGLYFNDTSKKKVGLFGYLASGGKISNVGVLDSYFQFNMFGGGVCGYNYGGKILNSYNNGIVSGKTNTGGVCGYNQSNGEITNCHNSGTISGTGSGNTIAGVCGYNDKNCTISGCYNTGAVSGQNSGGVCFNNYGIVKNCYNTGSVSGQTVCGGVCGNNNSGTVTSCYNSGAVNRTESNFGGICGNIGSTSSTINCYYDSDIYSGDAIGINYDGTVDNVMGKTTAQFNSGEVCYLLNGSSPYGEWGQQLEENDYPVLGSAYKVLRAARDGKNGTNYWATFSNRDSNAELTAPTGNVTVYNATVSGGKLTLAKRSDNKVAKSEGVLLKAGCEYLNAMNISETVSAAAAEVNHLVATPAKAETVTADNDYTLYRLTYNDVNQKEGLGFYLSLIKDANGVVESSVGKLLAATPGKAYLKVATAKVTQVSGAAIRGFAFPGDDGETTGIECISVTDESMHRNGNADGVFDLQGRKVSKPTKGVYIKNNKLFLN